MLLLEVMTIMISIPPESLLKPPGGPLFRFPFVFALLTIICQLLSTMRGLKVHDVNLRKDKSWYHQKRRLKVFTHILIIGHILNVTFRSDGNNVLNMS